MKKFAILQSVIWKDDYTSFVLQKLQLASVLSAFVKQMQERQKSMKNQKLLTNIEGEVQELTEEDFISAVPFSTLPEALKNKLAALDAQQVPIKESLTLQLSQDVVQRFRATGEGWQILMESVLKDWLNTHLPE
jgi:uncharacterized protein (DUF4415 family)